MVKAFEVELSTPARHSNCALAQRPEKAPTPADLTDEAVASIRELVGSDVHRLDGERLPFAESAFVRVVVVDMLEHVPDEAAFATELARVTKPGGRLVVNTPHLKRTLLRRFRHAIGQTDAKHGHLRPGYTAASHDALLGSGFIAERHRTYSRFFSELVDTLLNWAIERLGKKGSAKGMVVNGTDVDNGTINGGDWYIARGTLQDWSYLERGCLDYTIEISYASPLTDAGINEIFSYNRMVLWRCYEQDQEPPARA